MIKSVDEAKYKLIPVFINYGISKAVLFGSIAKGASTEKSDIDLYVDSDLKGLEFVGFIEAVREATGMQADVFNKTHIKKDSLIDREIRSTGVTIYEK